VSSTEAGRPRYLDAATIATSLPPASAVEAITAALRAGLDPADDIPRTVVPAGRGQLLVMPAQTSHHVGVKLVTVAPENPARGLPRISGTYVVFDAQTLRPTHLLDGVALTNLRTPAVSVAAIRPWLDRIDSPLRVVAFGAGPQAIGHLQTVSAVHSVATVALVVREPERVRLPASMDSAGVFSASDPEVTRIMQQADLVVCATTARTPLYDSRLLGDRAIVVAVGSHEPDAREVDSAFCARAAVIVEERQNALRECGDIVLAIAEGALRPDSLIPIRGVALGERLARDEPVLFKGSGMSWQDLVITEAVLVALAEEGGDQHPSPSAV
jgi:ornithine cyclodeaminase/alanine dehydrogenase-like protein (mu-crystallin family)